MNGNEVKSGVKNSTLPFAVSEQTNSILSYAYLRIAVNGIGQIHLRKCFTNYQSVLSHLLKNEPQVFYVSIDLK